MVDKEFDTNSSLVNKQMNSSEVATFLQEEQQGSSMSDLQTYAIRGINLNKTYSRREFSLSNSKNPKILDDLNINVAKGKMYNPTIEIFLDIFSLNRYFCFKAMVCSGHQDVEKQPS
jgi:hypothetical protein